MTFDNIEQFKHHIHCMVVDSLNPRNILTIMPEPHIINNIWNMYTKKLVTIDDIVVEIEAESTYVNNLFFSNETFKVVVH